MSDVLRVLLHGRHAADLTRQGQRLTLTYLDDYARDSEATPISLSMPAAAGEHPTKTVEPWLWGLLPDNEQVLARWGRTYQVSARNVFGLLTHVGEDCAGAVQFVRDERIVALRDDHVEWLSGDDVGHVLLELATDHTAWHQKNRTGQFSLAGAQPKTALHFDGSRWGRPFGKTPSTHILKPAIVGLDDHDLNEHLCLRTAQELGLPAARSRIESFNGQRALVVERYDRFRGSSGVSRVHQEDACQALSVHPARKYQSDGGPSPQDVAGLFWRDAPRAMARQLAAAFTDALALNWLIAGTDAHAKNYSLLLRNRDVRLAPLYDVASALPYAHLDRHDLRLAMKVGNTYDLAYIGRSNWVQLAKQLGLPPAEVLDRVVQLAERLPEAMSTACADRDILALDSPLPQRLLDLTTDRARACRERLREGSASAVVTSTAPSTDEERSPWNPDEAAVLLAALAPPQTSLLMALVEAGGQLASDEARLAMGRPDGDSLRGSTGPITKALRRLQLQGLIRHSVVSPVRAVYEGSVKAARLELHPAALQAFATAMS